jgi:hypothetical protein
MSKRRNQLDIISKRDGAVIIEIQQRTETCKQHRVVFNCFCGEEYSKQVNDVCGKKDTGLLCYEHSLERKRRRILRQAIEESSKRDNATYSEDDIKWRKDSKITFKCFCGAENTKTLWGIRQGQGMFCKEHTAIKTREKIIQTSNLNYGTNHPQQSDTVKAIIRESCMRKYGVEHLAHVPEIHFKQHCYKFKDYVMPSGDIRKIQGYENLALDELLDEHPEQVISTKRFAISYMFEDEEHYYYPDILLEYEPQIIIEVKSSYTMYDKKFYLRNLAKKNACLGQGYKFEFWIYDKKLNKTIL